MSGAEQPTTSAPTEDQSAASVPDVPAQNGDAAATESTSNANETAVAVDAPALPPTDADDKQDTGKETDLDMKAAETTEAASSSAAVVAPSDGAEGSAKKDTKRRSSTGVPEHKGKKLNKKKSVASFTLQLDAKPGDYYWARLKGYPPWPAIICDDEMLPESLLANRPVTAMRPDGSYREDFMEGGKNVRDRTYPVMYLFTNEFSWMPNIDLKPLDIEDVKSAGPEKKTKQLWGAYQVAAEGHSLQHFKDLLSQHEEDMREEAAAAEAAAEEKAAKAAKKATKAKKSKDTVDEDTEMVDEDAEPAEEDAEEGGKKTKASKKRKKDAESEGEGAKPAKTPKTKSLKLNTGKAMNGDTPASKPKSKAKTSKAKDGKEAPKQELTEAERRQKREKEVLYFRHKLQKGFLSSEPPKDAEMKTMADYFTQLEGLEDLEQAVIRGTKIHKVLKAILKLGHIPKDEDYHFKDRSLALLTKWQKVLDDGTPAAGVEDPDKTEVALAEEKVEETEAEEKKDVEMTDEKDEEAEQAEVVAADTAPAEPKSEPAEAPVEPSTEIGNDAQDEADNAPPTAEVTAPSSTEEATTAASGTDVAAANNLL